MDQTLLTIGATLVTCVLAVVGLHSYAAGKAQREDLVERLAAAGQSPMITGRRRRFTGVDRRLRTTGLGRRIEHKIAVTGLDITPGEYVVAVVAGLLAVYFVVGSVFAPFFGL